MFGFLISFCAFTVARKSLVEPWSVNCVDSSAPWAIRPHPCPQRRLHVKNGRLRSATEGRGVQRVFGFTAHGRVHAYRLVGRLTVAVCRGPCVYPWKIVSLAEDASRVRTLFSERHWRRSVGELVRPSVRGYGSFDGTTYRSLNMSGT